MQMYLYKLFVILAQIYFSALCFTRQYLQNSVTTKNVL